MVLSVQNYARVWLSFRTGIAQLVTDLENLRVRMAAFIYCFWENMPRQLGK